MDVARPEGPHAPEPALPLPDHRAALRRGPPRARHPPGRRPRLPGRLQRRPPPRCRPRRPPDRPRARTAGTSSSPSTSSSDWSTTATTPIRAPSARTPATSSSPACDRRCSTRRRAPCSTGPTCTTASCNRSSSTSASPASAPGRGRQPVSYSTLGINQLGAVYEGLMAYSGFLATEPLFEIDKDGDPDNGSWVIPVDRADEFPEEVFLKETLPDGSERRVRYEEGEFVFRLSGRDRQRSASYYTPEVLTEFTVRHALDVLFEENPDLTAEDILNLTVCEPALGSGAFLTEAITQLASRYLKAAQDESGEVIDADRYQLELQRAKAHFAVNQAYGVDLNQTAVELAEVSLWLACMHDGLQAPWFGARLRRGNSLVGARRETYTREQVARDSVGRQAGDRPDRRSRSARRRSGRPRGIHHFLVPGQGWGAAADAKEIKELDAGLGRDGQGVAQADPQEADRPPDSTASRCCRDVSRSCGPSRRLRSTGSGRRPASTSTSGAPTPPAGERFGEEPIRTVLRDPRSATSRLRTLMDAWCSLWLWAPQHGTDLPTLRRVAHRRRGAPAGRRAVGFRRAVRRRARARAPGRRVDRRHRRRPPVARARSRDRHDAGLVPLGARVRPGVRARRLRPSGRKPAMGAAPVVGRGRTRRTRSLVRRHRPDPGEGPRARRDAVARRRGRRAQYLAERAENAGTGQRARRRHARAAARRPADEPLPAVHHRYVAAARQTARSALLHPDGHLTDPKAAALRARGVSPLSGGTSTSSTSCSCSRRSATQGRTASTCTAATAAR